VRSRRVIRSAAQARSSPPRRSTNCNALAATTLVTMCIGGGQGIAAAFERL
jgi:acetyl-CoA acetyltransferase